jgi:hypothetical protein
MRPYTRAVALVTLLSLGLGLHVYIAFFMSAGGSDSFGIGLLQWSIVPYLVAGAIALISRNALMGIVAVALVLLVDAWTYYEVFIHPKGSTAALALLWIPLWNLVLVVPLGALAGWIWSGMLPADQNAP